MKNQGLKILAFTNGTASHKWRLSSIADRINNSNSPHQMYVTEFGRWGGTTLGADIVIIEMLTAPAMIEACHAQGAKVIFEADDAFIDTYTREDRKNLQHMGPGWRDNAIKTVATCDAITTTNTYLRDNFKRFTDKPIHILPNYMDTDWYPSEKLRIVRNTDEVRIGWFGSKGHYEDLRMVVPALKNVLEKYPQAKFVYCGFGGMSSDRLVTEVGWGEDVFKEIPRNRREFVIAVDEHLWPMKHQTLDLDIGIAPLIDDPFNHCKTNIKWQEYAMLETPCVASPVVYAEHPFSPSKSTIDHGKTGFIAENLEDWEKYLGNLIESKPNRVKIGRNAKKEVLENWNIDRHINKWLTVYESLTSSQ